MKIHFVLASHISNIKLYLFFLQLKTCPLCFNTLWDSTARKSKSASQDPHTSCMWERPQQSNCVLTKKHGSSFEREDSIKKKKKKKGIVMTKRGFMKITFECSPIQLNCLCDDTLLVYTWDSLFLFLVVTYLFLVLIPVNLVVKEHLGRRVSTLASGSITLRVSRMGTRQRLRSQH